MQLLPHSLTAIRVFDAVARHLSCSRAAEELCLTQSAVSKQLQSLERHLGVRLFARAQRGLELTNAGLVYWSEIQPALSMLASATAKIRSSAQETDTIYLSVPPTLLQKWLMPRLRDFLDQHAQIRIQFMPRKQEHGAMEEFTAEIRSGKGIVPGMHSHYLLGCDLYVVCSRGVASRSLIASPEDLLQHQLLEHAKWPQMWQRWFTSRQISGPAHRQGMQRFNQFSGMIAALLAGMGVALLPLCLIEDELRRGDLVILFEEPLSTGLGYHLLYPKDPGPSAALRKFLTWLLSTCAATASDCRRP